MNDELTNLTNIPAPTLTLDPVVEDTTVKASIIEVEAPPAPSLADSLSAEELAQVDRGYVVATRKSQYSTEALIRHKNDFKRTYPRLAGEPVTLDELMVFVVKGDKA